LGLVADLVAQLFYSPLFRCIIWGFEKFGQMLVRLKLSIIG
jgi:hypothetical protein